jgi:drug/metabolite transporter (DMT)-like permease
MDSRLLGYLLALGTACCWAQNSLGYSYSGKRVTSQTVAHIRLWLAFPMLLLVHFFFCGTFFPSYSQSDGFWLLALSGFTGFFICDICMFKAFVDIGPREGMVLMSLSPILGALFAWLFIGEDLTFLQITGILITVAGIAWVIHEEKQKEVKNPHLAAGTIAGLAAAVMQAVSMVIAKQGIGESSLSESVSGNLIRVSFGLIGVTLFALFRRNFIKDFKRMKDRKALSVIAICALVGPVAGMIAGLYSLTLAKVGIVTTLMQLAPVILIPIEVFVLKQKLKIGAVIGTLMAVAGAAMLFLL